jgi:hypothetical protein
MYGGSKTFTLRAHEDGTRAGDFNGHQLALY